MATPYALVCHEETISTQDDAARLHGEYPVLVMARRQSAGRGRSGALWSNAPVALAMSVAFRPTWETPHWPRLSLVAGVAVAGALDIEIGLKWPNDIVIGDAKAGGILAETSGDVAVIGCGLNLYWPNPPSDHAALFDGEPPRALAISIAQRWCEALLVMAARPSDSWLLDEYRRLCSTIGTDIVWQPDGSGRAVDVSDDGSLVVETESGLTTISAGAVRHVRPRTRPNPT